MILVALLFTILLIAFLIGPVWYQRSVDVSEQSEENLRLYQERKKDLEDTEMDAESKQALALELDREFLAATQTEDSLTEESIQPKRWLAPVILLAFIMGGSLVGYQFWGASVELAATDLINKSYQRELLPDEEQQLIEKVAQAAKHSGKNFEWAFLNARLNMNQGNYDAAADAFADLLVALPIEADEDRAAIMMHLAQARFAAANQQPTDEIYELLDESLKLQPEQAQARGMAGMIAFQLAKFEGTIKHWGELWKNTSDTEYADMLEEGIRRAADELEAQGEQADLSFLERTAISVRVDATPEAKQGLPDNTTVFVAATAVDGPPMPLAAERLVLGELPVEILLSDAQAMMPNMSLSDFEQVSVRATISISGEPSAQKGDWQGEVSPVANDEEDVIEVMINKQL